MLWSHSWITTKLLMVLITGSRPQWSTLIEIHWPDFYQTNPQPGRTDFNKTKSSTRKNIFIFLSNTGGKEITDAALSTWREGKSREEISFAQVCNLAQIEMLHWKFLSQLEPLIAAGAFNEAGGLQFSRVIERSLVDVFVPFLPLERTHVRTCVHNELQRRGLVAASEVGFFRRMNMNIVIKTYLPGDRKSDWPAVLLAKRHQAIFQLRM